MTSGDVHAYGAAGFTVCGQETGGAISRADGTYRGPRARTTTVDSLVTCAACAEILKELA